MKKHYKIKKTNITKLKSYLDKMPKLKKNERSKRHNSSRDS